MRVIIGGSRSVASVEAVEAAIAQAGWAITEVITGNSRGADAVAAKWAKDRGVLVTIIPVEWSKYGGRADAIRNERIADMAEACILVWDGFSRGTANMIEVARARNLPLVVYSCNPQHATDRKTTSVFRTDGTPGQR